MQTLQLRELKKPTEKERLNVSEKKELSRPESEATSKLVGTKREITKRECDLGIGKVRVQVIP